MIGKIAAANMRYHKSKNILTGIAVFLTTLLLFIVPAVGYDAISGQQAVINELYPTWHALFRDVTGDTAEKLSVHHMISRWGLRSDVGYMASEDAEIAMLYLDEEGLDLYHMELAQGRLPETENEIVVSEGILEAFSQSGKIGDVITVPCQVYRNGGLDYIQEKEFVISGFIADTEINREQKAYSAFVSKAFLEKEIPEEQIKYRFLFRIKTGDSANTDEIEEDINALAKQFDIPEQSVGINKDYLGANYVDPSYVPAIAVIMLIIVGAGMITIYGIYYVSMGERIQEYGKIKAIGATRRQLILDGKVQLYHVWFYFLAAFVAVLTVFLSLLQPMKIASKVSEIEAMRYQDSHTARRGKKVRKGYTDITIGRLANIYLAGNKKKSAVTIFSMAATGLLVMVVATVLSCANPAEASRNSIHAQYELSPVIEYNNKEHPELEWGEVQKENPLTEELKKEILQINGITSVETYTGTYVTSDAFDGDREWLAGVPKTGKQQLEEGIIEGNVTYEELKTGDKVIADKNLLYWWPDIRIGDVLDVVVEDGNGTHERKLEIAAIGDYPLSFTNYRYLIMAQEGLESFSNYNLNYYYNIHAEKPYDPEVEVQLKAIAEESGRMELRVWKDVYEEYKSNMAVTGGICYAFLGVLGMICIMNMINTMIHSIHVRKKDLGILQAVGMSDTQLRRMLQMEGLFYTAGTLLIAVGGGSLAGYPIFLWAKDHGIFNISSYHYPIPASVILTVVLVSVQMILTVALGKIMKKESLIDRIRFMN
ncbi:MAG: ABC transporter permease [Blautia sp.]|nr:FtsX-like permease family protein [Blautia sp.]MDY3999461.1 ABC transporter permease [Blautia sp.]